MRIGGSQRALPMLMDIIQLGEMTQERVGLYETLVM